MKKSILYLNIILFIVAFLFAVNTFNVRGHQLIQSALAAISSITGGGTINYIARFAGGANPSNQIGDSIIYDDGVGNVGIGTTGPGAKLDVVDATGSAIGVRSTMTGTSGNVYGSQFNVTGATAGTNIGSYAFTANGVTNQDFRSDGTGYGFYQNNTSAKNYFAGNVGIGTTGPGSKLHVIGGAVILDVDFLRTGDAARALLQAYDQSANVYRQQQFDALNYNWGLSGILGKMVMDSSGNVGIGTTAPVGKVDVRGGEMIVTDGVGDAGTFRLQSTINQSGEYAGLFYNAHASGNGVQINGGSTSSQTALAVNNNGGTSLLYVRGNGNVGIGTTGPGAKLDVVDATGSAIGVRSTMTGTSGNVYGSQFNVTGATAGTNIGSYAFTANGVTNQDFRSDGTGYGFYQNNTSAKNYFAGNVGIGTTAPGAKLDVAGNVQANTIRLVPQGAPGNLVNGMMWME
ncbi:MAG: hypothetical protein AAB338_01710 [Patescibacteria group bacterium]